MTVYGYTFKTLPDSQDYRRPATLAQKNYLHALCEGLGFPAYRIRERILSEMRMKPYLMDSLGAFKICLTFMEDAKPASIKGVVEDIQAKDAPKAVVKQFNAGEIYGI